MTSQPWQNERGSTLILVVLLTLILSATAIVALRDVARSARSAGVYRTRAQAQITSDSINRVFADWAGNKASTLIDAMQKSNYGAGDQFGVGDTSGVADKQLGMAILGGELEFNEVDLADNCGGGCTPLLTQNAGTPEETGLFQIAATDKTFESRRKSNWRVKIRDVADGMPAIGYSESFCFKRALIASESQVGVVDPDWNRANNVAQSRHGTDAMIGPVECGYN